MKGMNIFTTWIREFCSLVFIQTIQAFIFAIIIILIISVMSPAGANAAETEDIVASTGLVAVIALASISKIEELVKKIFKIQSGVTDPSMRGGMKSLATTMMAAKLAGRVGDNFKKIGGGIAGTISANKAMTREKGRFARDMKKPVTTSGGGAPVGGSETEAPALTAEDYQKKAMEAKKAGDMRGYERYRGIAAGMNKSASIGPGAVNAGSGKNSMDDYYKKLDAYQDKMDELKKKRRDAIFSGISGITETAGAASFGTIGALGGAALGEGKEIIQGGLAGMGVGDYVGGLATRTAKAASDMGNELKDLSKTKERFIRDVSATSVEAKNAIEKRRRAITKYGAAKKAYEDFERDVFDVGDID